MTQRLYSTAKTVVMYTWTPYRGLELIRLIQGMRNVDPSMQAEMDFFLYVKLAWLNYYPFDHVQCNYKRFYWKWPNGRRYWSKCTKIKLSYYNSWIKSLNQIRCSTHCTDHISGTLLFCMAPSLTWLFLIAWKGHWNLQPSRIAAHILYCSFPYNC